MWEGRWLCFSLLMVGVLGATPAAAQPATPKPATEPATEPATPPASDAATANAPATAATTPAADAEADAETDDDDDDWGLDDDPAAQRKRFPMVLPDFSRQPVPPGADWKPGPQHRWIWSNVTAGRVNPLGFSNRTQTGYRLQLWQLPGALYENSFLALQGSAQFTPAFTKLGGVVEFQPLAILNLSARLEYVGAFASFNFLQAFDSPSDAHDDGTLDTLNKDLDLNQNGAGWQVTLGALLQAKIGNIAVRNQVKGYRMDMDIPDGKVGFYDPALDILYPNQEWALTNETDLLYVTDFGLTFGARYSYTDAFYAEADAAAGEVNVPTHRIGPAILYTFFEDKPPSLYNKPTVALLTQWWAKHRYRTGGHSSEAIPYLLLAFIQRGDLLP